MSEVNEWERTTVVWARFQAEYPGYRMGVWNDPEEGPVWISSTRTVVEVTHREPWWHGRFHLRTPQPEQTALGL